MKNSRIKAKQEITERFSRLAYDRNSGEVIDWRLRQPLPIPEMKPGDKSIAHRRGHVLRNLAHAWAGARTSDIPGTTRRR
jgi:hypothetical protein